MDRNLNAPELLDRLRIINNVLADATPSPERVRISAALLGVAPHALAPRRRHA